MGTSLTLRIPLDESKIGGASRDRTGDLYNAIVALSQLSYGPTRWRAGMLVMSPGSVKRPARLLHVPLHRAVRRSAASRSNARARPDIAATCRGTCSSACGGPA